MKKFAKCRRIITIIIVFVFCFGAVTSVASACSCKIIDRSKCIKGSIISKTYQKTTYGDYYRIGYPKVIQKAGSVSVGSINGSTATYSMTITAPIKLLSSNATIAARCGYSKTKISLSYSARTATRGYNDNRSAIAPYKRSSYQYFTVKEKQRYYCKSHREYMTKYNANGFINGERIVTSTVKMPYANIDPYDFMWGRTTSTKTLPTVIKSNNNRVVPDYRFN